MTTLLDPAHADLTQTAPDTFSVQCETPKGSFTIAVTRQWAPAGADRFYNLVSNGYYDGCRFFRVVPNFIVQFGIHGDPQVSAVWRKQHLADDKATQPNRKGTLTYAMAGPNTRTTQLFINFKDNNFLDSQGFSPFGEVTEGMDVVEALHAGYGEKPDQHALQSQGNAYLERDFPDLDYISNAKIV